MDLDVDDDLCGSSCTCSACMYLDTDSSEVRQRSFKRNHPVEGIARVEIENEAAALREALSRHQQSILDLCAELEAERNASASATSEAMAMILRLQREKAECLMEARQFRRFAEEKMAHDQQEIATLEDLLFKKDQAMQSLSCEVQAYKHRLLSLSIVDINDPIGSEPNTPHGQMEAPPATPPAPNYDYPPLRCALTVPPCSDGIPIEADKYGDTPREHLQKLEQRIFQLEKMPSKVTEKGVVVRQSSSSPRFPRHLMRNRFSSFDSFGSHSGNFYRGEEFPVPVDRPSAFDADAEIYTVRVCGGEDSCASTPRELGVGPTPRKMKLDGSLSFHNGAIGGGGGVGQEEIHKLQTRLQALEADRESMRQTLISMSTDKAQMVLLREIAQQFRKDSLSEKKPVKHAPLPKPRTSSLISVIKWITSVVFWRKRSSRIKYPFGLSSNNAGLLLLLDKSPPLRQRRFLTKQRSSC